MRERSSKRKGRRSTASGSSSSPRPSKALLYSTPELPEKPKAIGVTFDLETFTIELQDGRTLSVPLEWSVLLRDASRKELYDWWIDAEGEAIHWNALDEDIRVVDLLYPTRFAKECRG